MTINSFSELYSTEYNIRRVFALNQYWSLRKTFTMSHPRPTNALLLFVGCSAKYRDDSGRETDIPRGSIFCIPKGSKYSWIFYDVAENEISTMLFEFVLADYFGEEIKIEKAAIIKHSNLEAYKELFEGVISEFSKPTASSAEIKSASYNLFARLSCEGRKNRIKIGKFVLIKEGIDYLETDIKQSMSISEIAEMCNISLNYFERLFKEYSGYTPNEYRLNKKWKGQKSSFPMKLLISMK